MPAIDVGQNPEAKALFLSGQLNIAVCPSCGHAGMLSTPLVYHDPEKELLFTYMPSELGLPETDQQRAIGELTNQIMAALPPEQRKGYLLRPRSFLRLEGMIEAILEADGITPEMLAAQRSKASLLEQLLRVSDSEARQAIVRENSPQIDYDFFQLLTVNLQLAQADGNEQAVEQLVELRTQLLGWTTTGQEVAAREEAIRELGGDISQEQFLEKLVEAALAGESTKVETMVAVARPSIDYVFYQQLTERINREEQSGNAQQAKTLVQLRETILNLTEEIDAQVRQATEQAATLLQQIAAQDDLDRAVRANMSQIDELFLNVLAANLQTAEEAGQQETAQRLSQIGDIIMKVIEESQPAEVQFLNQLLSAKYPEETQRLLEENRQMVDTKLLELMQLVGEDMKEGGRGQVADKLAQIQEQAESLVG
jgi:hypothetical protein